LSPGCPLLGASPEAPVQPADLAFLADALHLPHRLGPRAEALIEAARRLLARPEDEEAAMVVVAARAALRGLLVGLERGTNRELLYELHPYLIDLLEEVMRLLAPGGWPGAGEPNGVAYRGGLAERLMGIA
jgi:protein O-GlcNAcase/histone acetyltransferase